jgi:hypothetical protein
MKPFAIVLSGVGRRKRERDGGGNPSQLKG